MALTLDTTFPASTLANFGISGAANDTQIDVPFPGTVNEGDFLGLFVGAKPSGSVVTPAAMWDLPTDGAGAGGAGSQGNDTGPMFGAWYTAVATGAETGTTPVTLSGANVAIGYIIRISSATGAYAVAAANGVDSTGGASWSVTAGQSIPFATGDILFCACAYPTDASNASWTSESVGTGIAVNDWLPMTPFQETAIGQDMAVRCVPVTIVSGSATVAPSHTATVPATNTNVAGPEIFLRIREAVAVQPRPKFYRRPRAVDIGYGQRRFVGRG